MIGIICLVMESSSSSMLVFEDFSQDSLSITWLPIDGLSISLNAHSSSMDCIKLVFDIIRCPWWSLSASCCSWMWIIVTLSDRWSWNINFGSWSWYQILCLIAARLEHQTLVLLGIVVNVVLNWRGINRLPGILRSRLHLTILNHTIDDLLVVSTLAFPLCVFLVN